LKNSISDFIDCLVYVLGKEIREIFIKLISDFENEYSLAKQRSHVLDYNDLEFHSLDLFENHPHIHKKIKARFKAFLIDEFQDTNPLQMKLIEKLRPQNGFFAVGDPRQSIYGFRHADIRIMLNEIGKFESGIGEVVKLNENYRSRQKLLDCISGMFDLRQIDSNFSDMNFGRFISGREFKTEGKKNPVEVIVSVGENSEEARELEVQAVANRLAYLLNSGMKVEGQDGKSRGLTPGDCAILFRTKSRMRNFARAFEAVGIPYQISTGGGFYNQREVMDLINYLELMMNPYNVLSFAEVIRAPFYGISMDGLFTLINNLKTNRDGARFEENFWENREINLSDEDKNRFEDFQDEFEEILNESDGISVSDRLRLILDKTHFKGALASGRGGKRRLGNIDKLLNLADEWENDFPGNISGFIDRIKELRFRDVMEPESPVDSTDDSVSVMTIHAAKGLEFPLVILADATTQVSKRRAQWQIGAGGQIVLKVRSAYEKQYQSVEDMFYKNLIREMKEKEESEAFRLIYVALTRASEKLIISVPFGENPGGEFWDFFNGVFDLKKQKDELPVLMEIGEVKIPFYQATDLNARQEIYTPNTPGDETEEMDLESVLKRVDSWPGKFNRKRSIYSVTEFSTWLQCPLKYKFNYEMGFSGLMDKIGSPDLKVFDEESVADFNHDDYPDVPRIKPQNRGTIIHNLLSGLVEGGDKFSIDEFSRENLTDGSIISMAEMVGIADMFSSSDAGISLMKSTI
ncbi:MAG: 3'-5' exonuclease, partial [bacterium]